MTDTKHVVVVNLNDPDAKWHENLVIHGPYASIAAARAVAHWLRNLDPTWDVVCTTLAPEIVDDPDA